MKCKFEHESICCNSGCLRYKTTCYPELCGCVMPMSNGDAFRANSDKDLAKFLSTLVDVLKCPSEVWELYKKGLRYEDAWLGWLKRPCR